MRLPRKFARNINVICPVHPLREKYFAFAVGQISSTSSPRPFPARGALRGRHERGMGCGGRGSVGAQVCSQGGFRERAAARRRTALQRLSQNSTGSTWFVESFGRGRCVRRSRVVLASVADAKPCGDEVGPTGRRLVANPLATVTKRNSSPGSNCEGDLRSAVLKAIARARRRPRPLGLARAKPMRDSPVCLLPLPRDLVLSGVHAAVSATFGSFPAIRPSLARRGTDVAECGPSAPPLMWRGRGRE